MKREKIKFKIPLFTLCGYCEADLADTWDHIIPWSHGGENIMENLVPACRRCNSMASNFIFYTLQEKKDYIKTRRKLSKKLYIPKIIKLTPRIIIPPRITLATLIKTGKTHMKLSPKPALSVPLNRWVAATPENALLMALGYRRKRP